MARLIAAAFGIVVFLLVIAGFLFLPGMVNLEWYRTRITQTLERVSGRPASFESLTFTFVGGFPALELKNLEILSIDPTEPPFMLVKKVRVGITPLSLFAETPRISSLTLISPQVNIVQRSGTLLLRRARDSAQQSDAEMERELGRGLTDLTIGRISIRNGLLTILNWEHPEGQTLIFDRIQALVHALSSQKASPVSASARFQSLPFSITGQVGPLPQTLNPYAMPILLSLEAKSAWLPNLVNLFAGTSIETTADRGYFSTLFHGTLKDGLQTSSRLELDKLATITTRSDGSPHGSQKQTTVDLALRQKSVIRYRSRYASLDIQEFFLYLDGTPIIDIKGHFLHGAAGPIDITLTTLNQVNLDQFPELATLLFLSGATPSGTMHLHGDWNSSLTLTAHLDLTRTGLNHPPFFKKPGIPFTINLKAVRTDEAINLAELVLTQPTIPSHRLRFSGIARPKTDLTIKGNWNLASLPYFLPGLKSWNPTGMAQLSGTLTEDAMRNIPQSVQGKLNLQAGSLGPLVFKQMDIPFKLEKNRLDMAPIQVQTGEGRLDVISRIHFTPPQPVYQAFFQHSGITIADFPLGPRDNPVRVDGLIFSQGDIWGFLDKNLFPTETYSGRAHVQIEPGRLTGIDHTVFFESLPDGKPVSGSRVPFYWQRLATDLSFANGSFVINNLEMVSDTRKILLSGNVDADNRQRFKVQASSSHADESPNQVNLLLEGSRSGLWVRGEKQRP